MGKRVTVGSYSVEMSTARFRALGLCCVVTLLGIFGWMVRVMYLVLGGSNVTGIHGHLPDLSEISNRFKRQFESMEAERDRISKRVQARTLYHGKVHMPKMQGRGGGRAKI